MLDGVVREQQLGAGDSHILTHARSKQLLNPVRSDDLGIVVEQQVVVALCLLGSEVDDAGEVEGRHTFQLHNPHMRVILLCHLIVFEGERVHAVVLHDYDLVVVVGREFTNRGQAVVQNRHSILVRDDDGHQRVIAEAVIDLETTRHKW